jgi:TolB protein
VRPANIKAVAVSCLLLCLCACSSDLSRETIACHVADEPLFSGGEVTYRIYVMNGDGRERREVGEGLEVGWSPDGRQLVYVGSEYRSLHVVDILSGRTTALGDLEDLGMLNDPVWSPDGGRIAFEVLYEDIWVIDADSSNVRQLTDYGEGTCVGRPSWSPDSSRIAFSMSRNCRDESQSDIYVMDSDGSNVVRLTDGDGNYWDPVWSPVAERMLFEEYQHGQSWIYVMNADGSGKTRRATGRPYGWSPDGTRIYYHPLGSSELWTVGWDMANHTRLFTLPCEEPAWSPVIEGQEGLE